MGRRRFRIIGIENGLYLPVVADGIDDGVVDALTGLIGDVEIFEHPPAGVALAFEIAVINPLPRNALNLAEQVQFGLAVFVLEVFVEKVLGEIEGDCARPLRLRLGRRDHHSFADDPFHQGLAGSDHLGGQDEFRICGEICCQPLFRQIDAIAGDARENDLERRALFDGLNARGLLGRLDGRDLRLGREVKRNAHDVGIFGIELPFGRGQRRIDGIIVQPPKRAPDDLLAQKLGAEGADAKDVGDAVGVPALRQHGNGNDAADLLPKPVLLTDRVHHFTEKFGIRDFAIIAGAGPLNFLALELLDFERGHLAKILVERPAGLDLVTVDQERVGAGKAIAVLVEVPE